jgi:hypothetical protein
LENNIPDAFIIKKKGDLLMSEIINGTVVLNEVESRNFLHDFFHPDKDAIAKRDAFLERHAYKERRTENDDGVTIIVEEK